MFSLYGLKMNNEQLLLKNKIHTNNKITNIKPKILFRNDIINNIINGEKNSYTNSTEKIKYYHQKIQKDILISQNIIIII